MPRAIRSAVPIYGLRSANALVQQVVFGMRIVGPATAAFLVASFGAASCCLADSVSFVGSALLIGSVAFVQSAGLTAAETAVPVAGGESIPSEFALRVVASAVSVNRPAGAWREVR